LNPPLLNRRNGAGLDDRICDGRRRVLEDRATRIRREIARAGAARGQWVGFGKVRALWLRHRAVADRRGADVGDTGTSVSREADRIAALDDPIGLQVRTDESLAGAGWRL